MEDLDKIFFWAIKEGHLDLCIWIFREELKDIHQYPLLGRHYFDEAFRYAAICNQLHICKWLLSLPEHYKIDPAAQFNAAFIMAARWGHLDLCKWLLSLPKSYGIDPAASGIGQYVYSNAAFIMAAREGHSHICKWLLSLPGVKDPR